MKRDLLDVRIASRIDAEAKRIERLREKITQAMSDYAHRYREETREVDASPQASGEYREMLKALAADGLPRFEARFKQLLNENTIRDIAGFHAQLRREENEIRERIDTINASLYEIDFNDGRYILLLADKTADQEVREFQQDLRKCTEGALSGSEDAAYSEAKFLEVKAIMERFAGRKDTAEIDKKWSRKVTDVRNWFQFSASERYRATLAIVQRGEVVQGLADVWVVGPQRPHSNIKRPLVQGFNFGVAALLVKNTRKIVQRHRNVYML